MRPYFKNDLYNYATQKNKEKETIRKHQSQEKQRIEIEKRKGMKKIKNKDEDEKQDSKTKLKQTLRVDDSLTINILKRQNNPKIFDSSSEEISQMMKSLQKKKSKDEGENKSLLANNYKPKSSLVVKQLPKTQKTEKEEKEDRKKQYISMKKIQNEIKDAALNPDQKNKSQNKNQTDNKQAQKGDKHPSKSQKIKKIKKQTNYVRLDLKRTYKDRFLGGLHNNLRKYTRNGKLKYKIRGQSQLGFEDGEVFNSYVASLSKALNVTVSLEDSDQQNSYSSSQAEPDWVAPDQMTQIKLTECVKNYFGFQKFREGQYQTIKNILEGKSTIFVSQTASGKSLTYILSSMLMKGLCLVISPLVSLMLDQLAHLPRAIPAACISSLITREQRDRIVEMVKNGKVTLLFLTPECLQTDFIYHLEDFPEVTFTCIDEAHSLSELSHNFRTSFLALGDIVLNLIKYRNNRPTILGLTATANPQTVDSICQKLNISQVIRSSSCMNKNLFITISRQEGQLKYESLIRYLNSPLIQDCKGILVYTRTKRIMNQVFNYVTNSVPSKVAIYNSELTNKQKTETLQKFRNGEIKIVIATISLGMGLDFSNLQCVIHLNIPKSIQNYVQQIGRAGRRERRGYCHLFLDKNDYITERNYIIADEIQPSMLALIYDTLRQHSTIIKRQKKISTLTARMNEQVAIKRASILLEQCQRLEQVIQEQDEEQFNSDDEGEILVRQIESKKLNTNIFGIRVQKLKEKTQLREQALLTLLLKVQSTLKKNEDVRLKVLPVTKELIKIGFFKNNQQEIFNAQPFFKNLVYKCKKANGTTYINLIDKCNQLGLKPIQLLTKLYRISHKYYVKVQLDHPIFIWQFEGPKQQSEDGIDDQMTRLVEKGFDTLSNPQFINKVVQQVNDVQRVSLVKLNVMWSQCFLYSRQHITFILERKMLIPRNDPIPPDVISKEFDNYFKANLQQFYNNITNNGTQICIPTTTIDQNDERQIDGTIQLFVKHQMANEGELINELDRFQARRKIVNLYQNGKFLTRILMGISSQGVSWKIYCDRVYWMRLKLKNYSELLEAVKNGFQRYKSRYFLQ